MNHNWGFQETNFQPQQGFYLPHQAFDSRQCTTKAYINPHIANFERIKRSLTPSLGSNKIHVNPNFKQNREKNISNLTKDNLQPGRAINSPQPGTSNAVNSQTVDTVNVLVKSWFKKVNKVNPKPEYRWCKSENNSESSNSLTVKPAGCRKPGQSKYKFIAAEKPRTPEKPISRIYVSKTKIINKTKVKLVNNYSKVNKQITKVYSPVKVSFYKNKKSVVLKAAKSVTNKYKYYNNSKLLKNCKYKIDKRNKETTKQVYSISKLFPNNFHTRHKPQPISCTSKNICLQRKNQPQVNPIIAKRFPNKRVVKIGGILYKTTTNKLTLAKRKEQKKKTKVKNHVVYVRGEKFLLDNNGRTLRRQLQNKESDAKSPQTPKRIDIGGVTYIKKSKNVLVRTNIHQAQYVVNKAKNKSIAILTNLRKRSTMPCMIYHRFGKCNRHNNGLCMYKHDPKNIAICKMFLKGECGNNNCLLSHQVIPEKMATCRFFLNGFCDRENCPFPHIKLNKNVAICEKFLQGFCNLGKDCSKRHLHQCPNFDKFGTCSLGDKCHYPHKKQNKSTSEVYESNEKVHYFISSGIQQSREKVKKCLGKKGAKKLKMELLLDNLEAKDTVECVPKRIKLDVLPCYIPLQNDA